MIKPALFCLFFTFSISRASMASECSSPVDLLIVGDSQFGATWSKSYTGNFLQQCLKGNFVLYARGGTVPGNWLGKGGMDQIETIQRDPLKEHLNIGAGDKVPECKKRIGPMIEAHSPRQVMFEFGGNYIAQSDEFIRKDINLLMETVTAKGISPENCFFLHQTFEMEVATKRNVPLKNLDNIKRIRNVIQTSLQNRCQFLDGMDLMKDSPLFDGKELLRRIPIAGRGGCSGAASNDNAHVCGEAAQDFAQRVCHVLETAR